MPDDTRPEYQTPLPGLLAKAVGAAANRLVRMDGEWRDKVAQLEGHSARVELSGLELALTLRVVEGGFQVSEARTGDVDVVVTGTPMALFSMVGPKELRGKSGSRVQVRGDATVGQRFVEVLKGLDPDWDEPVAQWFGDVAGHQIASWLRRMLSWGREAASGLGQSTAEYLVEESRMVIGRQELADFADQVDELAAATERLLARYQHNSQPQ